MNELEKTFSEDPLRNKLEGMFIAQGYQTMILTDVGEGAFAAILQNRHGCTGPYAFFTGEPVPIKEDILDWYKFSNFEPEFQAYHYCPILPSKKPTQEDMIEMLDDARMFIDEVGQFRWKQWHDSL